MRFLLFCLACIALTLPTPAQTILPLNIASVNDEQGAFLQPLLNGVEVVALSETIHMTHEFPLVRLQVVRWLDRNAGNQVLAFEGSPEDVWISQDRLLEDQQDLTNSTSGLFPLWNTDEMRSVFAFEQSSWATKHPLYITAYDIQPGTGKGSSGPRVFQLLQERLKKYAPPLQGLDPSSIVAGLAPLTAACAAYKADDESKVVSAIASLEQWIVAAAPKIAAAYPNLPMHSAVLRSIPGNLRLSLSLCKAVGPNSTGQRDWSRYKQTRDQLSARFVLSVKELSPNHKLTLWAHWSHLTYEEESQKTSVGKLLHAALRKRLYSIATIATGGGTIVLFSDVNEDLGYTRVHGTGPAIDALLKPTCTSICFTNLQRIPFGSSLYEPQKVWIESGTLMVPLPLDTDGVIWTTHVHPPRMPLLMLIFFSGKHYIKALIGFVFLIVVSLTAWLYNRRRFR